jgi:apolipoprotein N-acyltransferase
LKPKSIPWAFELLLAAALGGLHSLPFVHTHLWLLQMTVLAVLAHRVSVAKPGRAAALGLVFGAAWIAAGVWWLFISMHQYGGLPAWMAVAAVTGLSAFLSIPLALAGAAFARWKANGWRGALLFGALWLLAELARGVVFTGFPWVASGYAQVDSPLASLAPWVGVYGIGFVTAVLAALLAHQPKNWRSWAGVSVVLAATSLGPWSFTQAGTTLSVSLLQGNVPQDEKFVPAHIPESLAWAQNQLLAAQGDLVVAPETIIPLLPSQLEPAYWQTLLTHFQRNPTQAALIGLPLGDEQRGYTNSAAGISASTVKTPEGFYQYDKHHLVPFGEFIPTGFKWFTQLMNIPLGDFNRGAVNQASFVHQGARIGVNICYEDLFGEELAARFTQTGLEPTIFANISNIGWFGNSSAIDQHLHISRLRALEFQRPMLRATNTGATAVINHQGQVTHSLPRYTQGALNASAQTRTGLTPFAWWAARFGLWPLALGAGLLVVALKRRA